MTISITWAALVCALGYLAWLGSKAWAQGEEFSLFPAYLSQHFGKAFLGLICTTFAFINACLFRETPIEPRELITVLLMAFGAISIIDHTPKKG